MHMPTSWLPLQMHDLGPAQPLGLAEDRPFACLTGSMQLSGNELRTLGFEEWADIRKVGVCLLMPGAASSSAICTT